MAATLAPLSPNSVASPNSVDPKATTPEFGSLSLPRLPPNQKNEIIRGLAFINPGKVIVQWSSAPGAKSRQVAKIVGRFSKKSGGSLTTPAYPGNFVWAGLGNSEDFAVTVPILAERTLVQFRVTYPSGKIENQTVVITHHKNKQIIRMPQWAGVKPTISLGVMIFNYAENYRRNALAFNLSEVLTTVKVSYDLQFDSWDLGASIFYTPLVLTNNIPGSESRLLSGDLSVGYALPEVVLPWRLSISLGLIYRTMMVASNYFGYKQAFGPQLTSLVQRVLPSNDTLYSYFKFAPLPSASFSFDLANREYCLGVGWLRPLGNQHPFSVNFEISDFLATVAAFYQNTTDTQFLHSTAFGLSASYGF